MIDNTIPKLEQLLKENSKVLLLPSEDSNSETLMKFLNKYVDFMKERKVLLLTDMQAGGWDSDRICHISTDEVESIVTLYDTYEFSDRFLIWRPENMHYGNLMHYVKNGLLTEEECFRALLED